MASAQIVETSVAKNSPSQDSNHPDDLFQSIIIIIIIIITSVPEEQALRHQALFHYLNHKDIFTISHFQRTR